MPRVEPKCVEQEDGTMLHRDLVLPIAFALHGPCTCKHGRIAHCACGAKCCASGCECRGFQDGSGEAQEPQETEEPQETGIGTSPSLDAPDAA